MDRKRLTAADRVIAVSTVVLFLASFLDWFNGDYSSEGGILSGSRSVSGWDVTNAPFFVFIPVVLALAALAVVLVQAFAPRARLPQLPIGYGQALFFAGVLAAALVLLKFIVSEETGTFVIRGVQITIDVSRAVGIYIALLAAVGFAFGGWLKWQEEKKGVGPGPTPF
jgi:hypothetical protein